MSKRAMGQGRGEVSPWCGVSGCRAAGLLTPAFTSVPASRVRAAVGGAPRQRDSAAVLGSLPLKREGFLSPEVV